MKTKPISKAYLVHESVCIKFSKWQNYNNGKLVSDCQYSEVSKGWLYHFDIPLAFMREAQGIFLGSNGTALYLG